ncbi:MAG: glycosyltransferase family 39 protein [Actinobacteria bacterium]|nr:glycosyltransferase family 39 protein [Actinomycetota bacterium]
MHPDARDRDINHLAAESRWGNRWLALFALLAGAAALRLVGVQYGLPFPLLNPDEESIVPRSWQMSHGGGLDPNWFDYPSLLMYVAAPFQHWADEPSYLAARGVVVVLGLAGIAAAWWLGDRAYGTMAGFIAAAVTAVEGTHVAYSRMAVTDVPLTLGVTVSLALMVSRRLPAAGVAIGLAASFKYPAFILLVPLVVAGWGAWRRIALSAALAPLAFLAANPYFAVHLAEALGDVRRVQRLGRMGWLGFEDDPATPVAFLERLWEGIGPALLIALAGLVAALVARSHADRILAAFVLAYFVTLLPLDAHFDRYLLPLVPALGALAGRFRALAPVTLLLLVVPLVWSIRETGPLTRTDTRVVAHEWMEKNLTPGVLVAADSSTAVPETLRVLRLALPGPGRRQDPERDLARLRELDVGYVLVTGAVADRVLAAREHYPREARFYDQLRRGNRRFYRDGVGKLAGPWVALYEL